ncbi:uncharacterized protein (DUF1778 family) [Constrictibacter sp. MBR-5]|jgi:uncharacterized protein (DUF1778 family)|uniref:type II toxin-antitoxin system TacA family antitoxin n=1 Tax=Constrictibacter sp. MBR-5 TaxID=3156467 RepID=UPI0033974B0C
MTAAVLERDDARQRRTQTINIRLPEPIKERIDRAAKALGKTRTEFLVDSASQRAEDVLLEQRFFQLDDKRYEEFMAALDRPPEAPEKLRKLMARKAPWER